MKLDKKFFKTYIIHLIILVLIPMGLLFNLEIAGYLIALLWILLYVKKHLKGQ